jgi:phosphoglycolate phosphatase-like HAD superfamily hydrolase
MGDAEASPRQVLMPSTIPIGDTPLDVKAARGGGAKIIAVATGVHERTSSTNRADFMLESLAHTGRFFDTLAGARLKPVDPSGICPTGRMDRGV